MYFNRLVFVTFLHLAVRSTGKLVDLTHDIEENMIVWPTNANFNFTKRVEVDGADYYAYNEFQCSEHIGTHFDAPNHFKKNSASIDLMSLDNFFLNTILIDISDKCKTDPNYALQVVDLNFSVKELASLKRRNNLLLIRTGYGAYWHDRLKYMGTVERDASKLVFPGLGEHAARKIVELDSFVAVGLDTLSVDPGNSQDFIVHRIFAENGIYGLENIANLDLLPERKFFHVYAFPMKIKGGTGSPARVVAKITHAEGKVSHLLPGIL
jgi:kynurenine formamidase